MEAPSSWWEWDETKGGLVDRVEEARERDREASGHDPLTAPDEATDRLTTPSPGPGPSRPLPSTAGRPGKHGNGRALPLDGPPAPALPSVLTAT